MNTRGPVPIDELAKIFNKSKSATEKEIKKIKETRPEIYTLNSYIGVYEGKRQKVVLYHSGIDEFLFLNSRDIAEVRLMKKVKKIQKPQKKKILKKEQKKATEDKIVEQETEKESVFFKNTFDWESIYAILETGATLDEVCGFLRCSQNLIQSECKRVLNMTFTQLRSHCFHAGNVKIRVSLFQSTIGSKNRKTNPLVQVLMARDRLGLGIKPLEELQSESNVIMVNGQTIDLKSLSDEELEKLEKEAKNE